MSANQGFMENKITAVMVIITTSLAKSVRCSDKYTAIRSLSLPTRESKSPVRLPPKYSSESCSKWS